MYFLDGHNSVSKIFINVFLNVVNSFVWHGPILFFYCPYARQKQCIIDCIVLFACLSICPCQVNFVLLFTIGKLTFCALEKWFSHLRKVNLSFYRICKADVPLQRRALLLVNNKGGEQAHGLYSFPAGTAHDCIAFCKIFRSENFL